MKMNDYRIKEGTKKDKKPNLQIHIRDMRHKEIKVNKEVPRNHIHFSIKRSFFVFFLLCAIASISNYKNIKEMYTIKVE